MSQIIKFGRDKIGLSPFEENKAENRIQIYSSINAYIRILAAKLGLGSGIIKFVDNSRTYYMGKKNASLWITNHSSPQQAVRKRTNNEMIQIMKQICLDEVENQKRRGKGIEELPPETTLPTPLPPPPKPETQTQEAPGTPEPKTEEAPNTATQETPSTPGPKESDNDPFTALLQKAESGDAQAQADLGQHFIEKEDYVEAQKWLKKSLDQKNADAYYAAAFLHAEGLLEISSKKLAFSYCFAAAAQGHIHAKLQLAHMYETGFGGIAINRKKALAHLQKAAEVSEEGKLHLIRFLLKNKTNGASPSPFNVQYAYDVCLQAMKSDHPNVEILNYMSTLSLQHKGDEAEAFRCTKLAAERHDPIAELNLANMYYNGVGTPQCFEKAFEWFSKAADAGLGEAQALLAFMCYNGIGCKASEETAKFYMALACEHNDPAVNKLLAQLISKEA